MDLLREETQRPSAADTLSFTHRGPCRDGAPRRLPPAAAGNLLRSAAMALLAGAFVVLAAPAGATTVWEDYQGRASVPGSPGTSDPPLPAAANNYLNLSAGAVNNLRAVSADPANATRTGSSPAIDNGLNVTLCNLVDNPSSTACDLLLQGRVTYALIRFPTAGTWALSVAHDDEVEVQLSTDYTNTNYRNASYDIPVGAIGSWTTSPAVFESLGNFTVGQPDSCALLRMYWNNQGGINFARLAWRTPASAPVSAGVLIPAAQLFDPGDPASSAGCAGSITGTGTSITLNKIVDSRVDVADQFRVRVANGGNAGDFREAITVGSGIGQQASTGAMPATAGVGYRLVDAMASGSASTLDAYQASIECTRNGTPFVPTPVSTGTEIVWEVTPAANEQITCNITNAAVSGGAPICANTNMSSQWRFGQFAGLDFSSGLVVVVPSAVNTLEGVATTSDNAGNLLFYTDGLTVWNRNDVPMPNGTGLFGDPSSTQSALIVPVPGSTDRYYLFAANQSFTGTGRISYSIVDMSLNGGLGDVTATKNVVLQSANPAESPIVLGNAAEKLSGVAKANGQDAWVVTSTQSGSQLYVWSVTASGVTLAASPDPGGAAITFSGEMDFSPDGTRLALANVNAGTVHVYDFDTTTGTIGNKRVITGVPSAYGMEFSPNSAVLYASRGGATVQSVYQFDMTAPTFPSTPADATATFDSAANGFKAIELGPDGRLYVAQASGSHTAVNGLDIVAFPDVVGTGAGYSQNPGIFPPGSASTSGLPNGFTCPVTALAVDWGDAPASYGTLLANDGPRHGIPGYDPVAHTAPLMLGARIDGDADGQPSANADGDDATGIDDEDALSGPIVLQPGGTSITLQVPVTNATGSAATLYAWIDLDGDGVFDAGEFTSTAVADGATSATLAWTGLAPLTDGLTTHARLRLTTAALPAGAAPNGGDARALGIAPDGEVEDHPVVVATSVPLTCEVPYKDTFGAGAGPGPALPLGRTTYTYTTSPAPNDGFYTISPGINGLGAWFSGPDHTGDPDGRLMLVNAGGPDERFFAQSFTNLVAGARYDFSAWITNVCNRGASASCVTLPQVEFRIIDPATGAVLQSLDTGPIAHSTVLQWNHYSLTFVASQPTVRLELVNRVPAAPGYSGNDLALDDIAIGQVCELGDAPDSYGTLNASDGAGHVLQGPMLGAARDGENDGVPGPGADGDDLNGIDDEDAFTGPITLAAGSGPHTLAVPVSNIAIATHLYCWIDFDGNGSFDDDEAATVTLASGATSGTCSWPGGASQALGFGQNTYARFRVTTVELGNTGLPGAQDSRSIGVAPDGEVEDHRVVTPTAPSVALTKALTGESGSAAGQAEPGEQLTYTITLANTGGSAATGYGVTDALDPNTSFVSASNGGSHAAGVVTWTNLTVPAGGSLTLTVVVTVNDPLPAGVSQIANVAYETGTTPPACPPAGGQCVVIPTAPSVSLTKALTGESGSVTGQAELGEQLTYTITLANAGGSAATAYGVTDALDPNTSFVSASNGGSHAAGVVSWTNLTVPAGGSLTLTVVVTVNDPLPAGVSRIANVAYETGTTPPPCPPAGGQCVVIPTVPQLSVAKSAGTPTATGTPGQFTLAYTITVGNAGGSAGQYDLSDTFDFNGATVTAVTTPAYASSTGDIQDGIPGGFGAPAGGTIVTGETLGALGSETWTYTVTYLLDDPVTAADCADPAGGLRNRAALGGGASGAPPATTCTGAPNVNLLKTAGAPVPTGTPNEFTLAYTVEVSNTGSLAGLYTLGDTLTFAGATVTAISTPVFASSTGDPQDGTLGAFAAPAGGTIVTDEPIAASGAERWAYTATYVVTDAGAAQDCADPAGGLRNRADLGGSFSGQSSTCTGAAAVVLGKSASGPTPTGTANEYAIDYLVSVQNNGTLGGVYDLADTFTFPGATISAVSAVTHGGGDPLSTPLGTLTVAGGTIVTGETIAAGGEETYAYRVTFTLDSVAGVGTCSASGGLRNRAALGGSAAGQVETCTNVPDLAVSKTATGPVPTGVSGQYEITYTVDVINAGEAAGTYDLADAFAYAGATVDAVSAVVHAGLDPLATTLGTLTAAGGTIVTGETIAAGGGESYTYTVTFTLTDPAAASDCADPAGGLRNRATLGGSATGEAATCTGAPDVTLAKALTAESGSQAGIAEPGEQLTYTITLTNAGGADAVGYGVTDPLDANVSFVSADNGGTHAGGVVTWTNLTVPANGTLALTVVVTVNDPLPAGVTEVANAAHQTGTPPPDCTATPLPPNCTITPTPAVVAIAKALAGESGSLAGVAEAGEQLTYTITLTNSGGSDAVGYAVSDRLDPNTAFVSADNGGVHAAGVVTWTVTVPASGSITLTVVVAVNDPLPAGVTQVANVAYQTGTTPPPCPPAGGQCVVIPTEGAVVIAKALAGESGSAPGVAEPGEQLTYTITLTNTGGSAVAGYAVSDRLDPNTSFVSATNGGVHNAGVVTWTATVPANGSVTLTVVVAVNDPLPAGVTQVANVAYQAGTTPPPCPPGGPQCVVIPTEGAVLVAKSVTDAGGNGLAEPGETLTYAIVLTNTGGSAVTGYGLTDALDPNTGFISADNGGVHAGGVVTWANLTIPASGTLSVTVVVTVNDPLPAGVGQIANVAHEAGTPPPVCTAVPAPANCATIPTPTRPQVQVTKTASASSVSPTGSVVYTVTVANVGSVDAANVTVSDPLPAGISSYVWTCAAAGGAVCPNASGSGALAETIATLPAGSTVVYTIHATIGGNPPGSIVNVVTLTPPGDAVCAPGNTPPPCRADVPITVAPPREPTPVPVDSRWMLLVLGLLLMAGALWEQRR
ncbi:PKD domain protein [Dokdonella koreensis DS-123]|uniref:PKD domain protein n=2 Tax=Dokdonella TaxID=323413 RepID=A0A167G666_9GAMM|nr:PKD domain protein [Dokdonella koreensis DS-123]